MPFDTSRLKDMSTDALHELNIAIVDTIRQRHSQRQWEAARNLDVGLTSRFTSKQGRNVTVRVDKINTKSVNCTELNFDGSPSNRTWRVAPTLLSVAS